MLFWTRRHQVEGRLAAPRRRGQVLAAATAFAVALALASCGTDKEGEADAPVKDTGSMDLTLALQSTVLQFADVYYAIETGMFEEAGLNLELIPNASTAMLPTIASGGADIALSPTPSALIAAKKDIDTRIIYNTRQFAGLALLSNKQSVDELKSPDCRIGTTSVGTTAFSVGNQINEGLELGCSVIPVGGNSIPTLVSGVKSGFFPAIVTSWDTALIAQQQDPSLELLIEPEDYAEAPLAPPNGPYVWMSVWGPKDVLASKATAIRTFLETLRQAEDEIRDSSPEEVAEVVHGMEFYSAVPTDVIAQALELDQGNATGKTISESDWKIALEAYETWGLDGFVADDPTNSYEARIDNSYVSE
jgi:ABC-type nitrate/sulfonate/bicarbonate transport system substrate-binding protein